MRRTVILALALVLVASDVAYSQGVRRRVAVQRQQVVRRPVQRLARAPAPIRRQVARPAPRRPGFVARLFGALGGGRR